MINKKIIDKIKDWNVLFVDDDYIIIETMKEMLSLLFTNVYYAQNGTEALKIFQQNKIDLVITDLTMPHMNGITMIKEMKKIEKDIKTLCISGHNENYIIDDIDEFAIDIITKPINLSELYTSFEKLLK